MFCGPPRTDPDQHGFLLNATKPDDRAEIADGYTQGEVTALCKKSYSVVASLLDMPETKIFWLNALGASVASGLLFLGATVSRADHHRCRHQPAS